jgi:hypothetical protein
LAKLAIDEPNWHLDEAHSKLMATPVQLELETKAVGANLVKVDALQCVTAKTLETTGGILDRQAQNKLNVQ